MEKLDRWDVERYFVVSEYLSGYWKGIVANVSASAVAGIGGLGNAKHAKSRPAAFCPMWVNEIKKKLSMSSANPAIAYVQCCQL